MTSSSHGLEGVLIAVAAVGAPHWSRVLPQGCLLDGLLDGLLGDLLGGHLLGEHDLEIPLEIQHLGRQFILEFSFPHLCIFLLSDSHLRRYLFFI